MINTNLTSSSLFNEISQLIETTKSQVAHRVNASLILLYWHIGTRINVEILIDNRAEYGEQIIKQLSSQLHQHYGRGFSQRSLFRMVQFAKQFPEKEIVSTLSAQLSWSHFVELLALDDPLKCQFYTEICRIAIASAKEKNTRLEQFLSINNEEDA